MSLDGFIAPKMMQMGVPPEQWISEWMELQKYVFEQRFFRESLKLGEGGETGEDNRILEETYNRTGVSDVFSNASVTGIDIGAGGGLDVPIPVEVHGGLSWTCTLEFWNWGC